ncbi:hypothetical protein NGRA_0206 [Nosema granulosis]|uniref:Uncharacterized protein n=1 Tax=Nosema granulosis TaxID=83296 RepID=A0A9P6H1U4_9MICR|nr:hypothetical protein NGRA_0206 [Nosema granulosis]
MKSRRESNERETNKLEDIIKPEKNVDLNDTNQSQDPKKLQEKDTLKSKLDYNIPPTSDESIFTEEYNDSKYQEEIGKLVKRLDEELPKHQLIDVYNEISKYLILCKNYQTALEYLEKSLDLNIKDNLTAIKWKTVCYRNLGDKRMYLKNLSLTDAITNTKQNLITIENLKKEIATEDTEDFITKKGGLGYSNIYFGDFFDIFIGILPEKDNEISEMIKKKDFKALDKALMAPNWRFKYEKTCSDGLFTIRMVRSCLFYLKGLFENAVECIENPSNVFEMIMKEIYLFDDNRTESPNLTLFNTEEIANTKNPTLIYFLAKLYLFGKNEDEYLRLINMISGHLFATYDILHFYYKNKDDFKTFKVLAEEALIKFDDEPKLLTVCGEFAKRRREYAYLLWVLNKMGKEDPRNLLFKASVKKDSHPDEAEELLRKALELEPTYWYVKYEIGDLLFKKKPEESKKIIEECLSIAANYDEIFTTYQSLLILEIKDYNEKYLMKK